MLSNSERVGEHNTSTVSDLIKKGMAVCRAEAIWNLWPMAGRLNYHGRRKIAPISSGIKSGFVEEVDGGGGGLG